MINHPLKVYNFGAGIRYTLSWWTHNKQYQIIVAKSEKAIYSVFRHICNEYPDVKINKFLEIELVSPSDQMCLLAEQHRHTEEIKHFLEEVIYKIKELAEEGYPLPPQFKQCEQWVPSYLEEIEIYTPNSFEKEWHPGCKNCNIGFALVDHTPESFFQTYKDAWRAVHPTKKVIDNSVSYSLAVKARDDESIWMATPDFGHHRQGVDLVQLQPGAFPYENVLFYFRLRREIDNTYLKQMLDEAKSIREIQQKENKEKSAKKINNEKIESINKTLIVFQKKD